MPYKKKDFKLLDATKQLFKEKDHFSKEEIKEHSILYILMNHLNSVQGKLQALREVEFSNETNNELKKEILEYALKNNKSDDNQIMLDRKYDALIINIEKNNNLKNILNKKNELEITEILEELIQELKEMNHLKQIEFLEKKVAKNLDESSYSELIKLKNELNSE